MRHHLNREMLAPNVWTFPVDTEIVDEFSPLVADHDGDFETVEPAAQQWKSDIRWVSAANPAGFERFQSAFDRLGIADRASPYLDIDKGVRLYAGFLVLRARCTEPYFHVDWDNTNNEAFTVMTPISGRGHDFGLLYSRLDGETASYSYRRGEAIMFGDNFRHSTQPGQSDEPVALLCFEFGTDRMEHWPQILKTLGYQAHLLRRPDGEFEINRRSAVSPQGQS